MRLYRIKTSSISIMVHKQCNNISFVFQLDSYNDDSLYKEPSPEYAPNNPEYFAQGSPEMPDENDTDVQVHPEDCDCDKERLSDDMPVDMDETTAQSGMIYGRSLTPSRGGCHIRHTLGKSHYKSNLLSPNN